MNRHDRLRSYSDTIEATLCLWDHYHNNSLVDELALGVLEMLLDKYYYQDPDVSSTDELLQEGYDMVLQSISADLDHVPGETIVRILGVIYFVARRRACGGRDYFEVIRRYVGLRGGPGLRVLPGVLK
jgi:hypothetical protein